MMNWSLIPIVIEIILKIFAAIKGFVDFNAALKINLDIRKRKKLKHVPSEGANANTSTSTSANVGAVKFSVIFSFIGALIYGAIYYHRYYYSISNEIDRGSSAATPHGRADRSEPARPARETAQSDFVDDHRQTQTPCPFRPGSNTFQTDTDACIDASSCDAAVRLCLGAAASLGRRVVPDLLCPYSLGEAVSLWERQELDRKFRRRRCYPESYAWLAGMKGATADTARAYWRTVVCPENPTVFDDRQFDPFRPLPFAACPN